MKPRGGNGKKNCHRFRNLKQTRIRLAVIQGGLCFYCQEPLSTDVTLDHFIPLSQSGANSIKNAVACHSRCNQVKGDRLPTRSEIEKFLKLRHDHGMRAWRRIYSLLVEIDNPKPSE